MKFKIWYIMKKIVLSVAIVLGLTIGVVAQKPVVLKFETHALLPTNINSMKIASKVLPGDGGLNKEWDFASMSEVSDFKGYVTSTFSSSAQILIPQANVELNEGGNLFYFKANGNTLEYNGHRNMCGGTQIYDKPIIRMKYPFSYNDYISGEFSGKYIREAATTPVGGKYSVKADGQGKLILPGNVVFENTLRVVTTISTESNGVVNSTMTYRWYAPDYRFPLLVVIQSATDKSEPQTILSAYTTYQPKTEKSGESISSVNPVMYNMSDVKTYPNPFKKEFVIEYKLNKASKVTMVLFDNSGRQVYDIIDLFQDAGTYSHTCRSLQSIAPGNYMLSANIDGEIYSYPLVKK